MTHSLFLEKKMRTREGRSHSRAKLYSKLLVVTATTIIRAQAKDYEWLEITTKSAGQNLIGVWAQPRSLTPNISEEAWDISKGRVTREGFLGC